MPAHGAPAVSPGEGEPPAAQRVGTDVWDWDKPLGYLDSIQAVGAFAAPILAGASFTLAALMLQASSSVARWPDIALLCLVGAGLAMIYAVQAIIWTRRYAITPDDLLKWLPEDWVDGRPTPWLKNLQRSHSHRARVWAGRSRAGYHLGILLLLAGVAVSLVPPGHITPARWLVIGTGCGGVLAEASWIFVATLGGHGSIRYLILRSVREMVSGSSSQT
jgi:hypothetical protein